MQDYKVSLKFGVFYYVSRTTFYRGFFLEYRSTNLSITM